LHPSTHRRNIVPRGRGAPGVREPGNEAPLERIHAAPARVAGTPTLAEIGIVLHAKQQDFPRTDLPTA